jgi:uncharacterized damage-inducible protein DinB
MELRSIEPFLEYFDKVRARTMRVVNCIPPDKLEYSFAEGRFTLGDLARHLAVVERYTWAECVQGNPHRYSGCGREFAEGLANVIAFMERLHRESMQIFSGFTPEELADKCLTPEGSQITRWKALRLMVEHEIHHRGEIYAYLGLLGVKTPPLYGMTSEQLQAAVEKS